MEDAFSSTNNCCSLDPAATGDFSLVKTLLSHPDAFSAITKCCLLCSSRCRPKASPPGPAGMRVGGHVSHASNTCYPHTLTCWGVQEGGHREFNEGFNNFRMGSACLFSQHLDNSDLLLAAQQARRCGGLVGSYIDEIDWPLQVLFFPFHWFHRTFTSADLFYHKSCSCNM